MAITGFKHKGLEELFTKGHSAKVGSRYHKNALGILDHIHYTVELEELQGVKDFHVLKGVRKETYSMHVSGNYCITFKWDGENAYDVQFEDYH